MTSPTVPPLPSLNTIEKSAADFAKDLTERVLSSALGGFLAGVTVAEPLNGSMWYAAGAAGVAAGFSAIKGIVARVRGNGSASLIKGI